MSDYLWLIAVIAVFYVLDVAWVVPPGAVVFSGLGGALRPRLAARSGLRVFGDLMLVPSGFLPMTSVLVSDFSLARLDDDALRLEPEYLLPPATESQAAETIAYADIAHLEVAGHVVVVNGRHRRRLANHAHARALQSAVERAKERSGSAGRAELSKASLACGPLEERIALWLRSSRLVNLASTAMFFFVLVWLPVVWFRKLEVSLASIALEYLVLLATVQATFWWAHWRLYPDRRRDRLAKVAAMLVSPADAMAAPHALSREVSGTAHPLAVASLVSAPEDFRALAMLTIRALRFPAGGQVSAETRTAIEAFAKKHAIDPATACAPPAADDGCVAYCPRCLEQFVSREPYCPSCPGVGMMAFRDS